MADFRPAAASALGIDSMTVIGQALGGDELTRQLLGQVKEQQDELKKKLKKSSSDISAAAEALLSNSTGGFSG